MTNDSQEIEVEVVEIDNSSTSVAREPARENVPVREWSGWSQWQGRVRRIDRRWWPLWVIPAVVVFVLVIALGVVIGLIAVVFALCRGLIRALLR